MFGLLYDLTDIDSDTDTNDSDSDTDTNDSDSDTDTNADMKDNQMDVIDTVKVLKCYSRMAT